MSCTVERMERARIEQEVASPPCDSVLLDPRAGRCWQWHLSAAFSSHGRRPALDDRMVAYQGIHKWATQLDLIECRGPGKIHQGLARRCHPEYRGGARSC